MKLYQENSIKPKVRRNFLARVALEPLERVVLLYDGTLLGSGKEGLAVTDRRVIKYEGNGQVTAQFNELAGIEPAKFEAPGGIPVDGLALTRRDGSRLNLMLAGASDDDLIALIAHIGGRVLTQTDVAAAAAPTEQALTPLQPRTIERSSLFNNQLHKLFYQDLEPFLSADEGLTGFAEGRSGSFAAARILDLIECIPLIGHVLSLVRLGNRKRHRIYTTNRRVVIIGDSPVICDLDEVSDIRVRKGTLLAGVAFTAQGQRFSFYDLGKGEAETIGGGLEGRAYEILYRQDFEQGLVF